MNRETLISIINKNGIRFLPVRRCSLCNEYIGYKFVILFRKCLAIKEAMSYGTVF